MSSVGVRCIIELGLLSLKDIIKYSMFTAAYIMRLYMNTWWVAARGRVMGCMVLGIESNDGRTGASRIVSFFMTAVP